MRTTLSALLIFLPIHFLTQSCAGFATAADKPNIIIFLADDLGYADIGVNGCKDIPTPNIDAIAKNGVRFTDGYATHPVCSPSRAALMSGMCSVCDAVERQDSGGPNLSRASDGL